MSPEAKRKSKIKKLVVLNLLIWSLLSILVLGSSLFIDTSRDLRTIAETKVIPGEAEEAAEVSVSQIPDESVDVTVGRDAFTAPVTEERRATTKRRRRPDVETYSDDFREEIEEIRASSDLPPTEEEEQVTREGPPTTEVTPEETTEIETEEPSDTSGDTDVLKGDVYFWGGGGQGGEEDETPENITPQIDSASISPEPAYITTELSATYANWQDEDGPAENPLYQWYYGDGTEIAGATTDKLDCSSLNVGDEVYCVITPNDTIGSGGPKKSNHITIQNIAPNIHLTSPNGEECWSGVRSILWDADDPDNAPETLVIKIEYQMGGAGWITLASDEENDGTYEWDTKGDSDSTEYKIRVSAFDGADSEMDESDNRFTVDNTPPTVSIISPDEGEVHYLDSIEVTGEAGDETSGVASILVNGEQCDEYVDDSFSHVLSGLTEGQNAITVTVNDNAGNSDESSVNITYVPSTEVFPDDPNYTIQDAMDDPGSRNVIYTHDGTYEEDVIIKEGKTLVGESVDSTIIKGHIIFEETAATVQRVKIHFPEGEYFDFTSSDGNYQGWKVLIDAGITALNSEITVKNCIIEPDPTIFTTNYGHGIQMWNLYDSDDISPVIEETEISYTNTAIYLHSHSMGGAINGEIRNENILENNTYGIVLRMHKEIPLIDGNTISGSIKDSVHITYEDGDLLTQRLGKISNNDFVGNNRDVFCDELGTEVTPTGEGNFYYE